MDRSMPTIAPDEGIDHDEQGELRQVFAQAEAHGGHGRGLDRLPLRDSAAAVSMRQPRARHSSTPCSRRWALKPLLRSNVNCFHGHDAVRTAAVRDDLAPFRQFPELCPKVGHGNGKCAREVSGAVLLNRPHVENRDLAAAHATQQFVAVDRLRRSRCSKNALATLSISASRDSARLRNER